MENNSELGSIISLRSEIGDEARSFNGTSTSAKRKQTRRPKSGTQSSSGLPYQAKLKGGSLKKKTGHGLWVSAVQNGGGMSVESLARPNSSSRLASSQGGGSKYLMDQLMQATGQRGRVSSAAAEQRSSKALPSYKSQEEYYDEVLELKKVINILKEERDVSKKKTIRMEEEIQRQAKSINELLNPNMQTNEMRRAVSTKNKDSAVVISSLQQKVFSLEQLLKVKEAELSKLKSDLKYTDLNEARAEAEVYYEELQRLSSEAANFKGISLSRQRLNTEAFNDRPQQMQAAIKLLADENARLVSENRSLKHDLLKASESKDSSNPNKDYEDMNRAEMLAKMTELEKHLKAAEKLPLADSKASPTSKRKGSQYDELTAEMEKLKETITKLKEDRTHYRSISDEYRTEIERLTALSATKQRSDSMADVNAGSKSILKKQTSRKSSTASINAKKVSHSSDERNTEVLTEEDSDHDRDSRPRKNSSRKKSTSKMDSDQSTDDPIVLVQAALRGHSCRQQYAGMKEETSYQKRHGYKEGDMNDSVALVQAAMRGHRMRKDILLSSNRVPHSDGQSSKNARDDDYSRRRGTEQADYHSYVNKTSSRTDHQYERGLVDGSQHDLRGGTSVGNLQQLSRPWGSKDDDDDSDEADSMQGRSRSSKSKEFNRREKSRQNDTTAARHQQNKRNSTSSVKERWGDRQPTRKNSGRGSSQFYSDGPSGDDDDDDDDLVIGSSSSLRDKKRPSLLDELF